MSKSQDLTIFAQETSTTSVQDPRSGRSSGVFHRTRSPSPRISLAFYSFILVWKNQAGVQQVRGSCVPGGPRASTVHWSFDVGYSVLQTVTCHRWSTSRFPVCLFNLGPQSCFHLPKDQLHMMLSNDMAPRNYTGISITPLPHPKLKLKLKLPPFADPAKARWPHHRASQQFASFHLSTCIRVSGGPFATAFPKLLWSRECPKTWWWRSACGHEYGWPSCLREEFFSRQSLARNERRSPHSEPGLQSRVEVLRPERNQHLSGDMKKYDWEETQLLVDFKTTHLLDLFAPARHKNKTSAANECCDTSLSEDNFVRLRERSPGIPSRSRRDNFCMYACNLFNG